MSLTLDVTAGKLAPVYILASAEPLLVDRALAAIREAAVPAALRAFNEDSVDGRGASASRILAAARTLPMMAERRLILVRDLADGATEAAKPEPRASSAIRPQISAASSKRGRGQRT